MLRTLVGFSTVEAPTVQTPGRGECRPLEGLEFVFDLCRLGLLFENVTDVLIRVLAPDSLFMDLFGNASAD